MVMLGFPEVCSRPGRRFDLEMSRTSVAVLGRTNAVMRTSLGRNWQVAGLVYTVVGRVVAHCPAAEHERR